MKNRRLTKKDKLERILGKISLLLIESAIGVGIILGIVWIIGKFTLLLENNTSLFILFSIITLVLTIREILISARAK